MLRYPKFNNQVLLNTTKVSLVVFYGDKPPQLIALIQKLQQYLADRKLTQRKFIAYQPEQVHGTIIGCEGAKTESGIISKWLYKHRQETKYIDFVGLIDYLQNRANFPLKVCFGGYNRHCNYNFQSRGQHLSVRSFQLQPLESQTIPVLIGWTWENNSVSLALDNLRRNLQQFNLLHKYHETPETIDNDFYLRLGTINHQLTAKEIDAIATDIRHLLETQPPLHITIRLEDLAFVQYQDLCLAPETTKVFPLAEISAERIEQLYSDLVNSL